MTTELKDVLEAVNAQVEQLSPAEQIITVLQVSLNDNVGNKLTPELATGILTLFNKKITPVLDKIFTDTTKEQPT